MIKMPKKLKQAWVEALRSGSYAQDQGQLRTSQGYCCLGVLQMVACQEVELTSAKLSRILPSSDWCEANGVEPYQRGEIDAWQTSMGSLFLLNDHGMPFSEIADIIERDVQTHEDSPCSQK